MERPVEYLTKGDVIVINYPFSDGSNSKKRPLISYIHPDAIYPAKKSTAIRKLGSLKDGKINEVTTAIIEILQQAPSPPPPASKALERGKPPKNE